VDLEADKDAVEFLRFDVEIIFLFDKDVFRFDMRFGLLDFFLFEELMVERDNVFRVPLE
jgi:hypothetical protein